MNVRHCPLLLPVLFQRNLTKGYSERKSYCEEIAQHYSVSISEKLPELRRGHCRTYTKTDGNFGANPTLAFGKKQCNTSTMRSQLAGILYIDSNIAHPHNLILI